MSQVQQSPRSTKDAPPNVTAAVAPRRCDAWIICLQSRRFVIIRRGEKPRLRSAEQLCRPVEEFAPGEPVYYNGHRDVIRTLAVY